MAAVLILVFLLVPILEVVVFIKVGSVIGVLPTLALTLATAVAGALLVRRQGFRVLADLRQAAERGDLPLEPLVHGGFLLIAGLCLLTPGFFTDALGFLLLVPPVRVTIARGLWRLLRRNADVTIVSGAGRPRRRGPVIDLEAEVIAEDGASPEDSRRQASPWLRGNGPTG